MSVIAAIPYYKCPKYIARAVESLLVQTYKELTIVVLNDGDCDTPPWPMLAHISDPRLVRMDLRRNQGPYFALQVALMATTAPYFLIQDADDWSHPGRVAMLVKAIESDNSDIAISGHAQFRENADGSIENLPNYWPDGPKLLPGPDLKLRLRHHGLFRTQSLRQVGGYYGGFRMSYDMFLTNLLLLAGRVSVVHKPVYNYYRRPGSLTTSEATGIRSANRNMVETQLRQLYSNAYGAHCNFTKGQLPTTDFMKILQGATSTNVSSEDRALLLLETDRLRTLLSH